jgi:hypothetical protein
MVLTAQATQLQSRLFRMLSDSGPKGLCALISYDTKVFCKLSCLLVAVGPNANVRERGAIGAWIKNVEGPPEEAVDTKEDLDLTKLDQLKVEDGDETPT